MSQASNYLSKYTELEIIGRGNFGSATLIRSHSDNNVYIAKKVLLGGLNQKEVEGAHLEVKLLKELKHPHIVEYKDSFVEGGMLIIIMEYCEEGDLAYFIKKKAQKQEFLDEKLVLNWFLQILLALESVHRKKILHRDIKSSNIFLRSNGTVKLGDFGISKILENTGEAAMTVVGTPYYMSPEVCENKPYTFKSDVWALGCVLYEMCTLKHAFSASNLLGLVYKIVREQNEPIPNLYTPELSTLVQKLLTKNVQGRPSIREIFMESLIQRTIEEFIRTDGQYTTMIKIPVKKTQLHNEMKKQDDSHQNGGNNALGNTKNNAQPNKQAYENETPQQRMMRRKEEQRREEEERLKNAARESLLARNQDKQRKNQELQGNISLTNSKVNASRVTGGISGSKSPGIPTTQSSNIYENYSGQQKYNSQSPELRGTRAGQSSFEPHSVVSNASAFSVNDRDTEYQTVNRFDDTNQSLNYSQSNPSLMGNRSNAGNHPQQYNQYGNPYNNQGAYGYNAGYGVKDQSGHSVYSIRTEFEPFNTNNMQTNFQNNVPKQGHYQDDRPLPALANKNKPKPNVYSCEDDYRLENGEDEYEEDFEEYWSDEEEGPNRLTLKATQKELSDVMSLYKAKLNMGGNSPHDIEDSKDNTLDTCFSQSEQPTKNQKGATGETPIMNKRIEILKQQAKQALGTQVFEQAYKYLKKNRELGTPEKKVYEELENIVGKKNLTTHGFNIDQIVFLESNAH